MNIFDNIAANLSLKYENSEFYKNKLIKRYKPLITPGIKSQDELIISLEKHFDLELTDKAVMSKTFLELCVMGNIDCDEPDMIDFEINLAKNASMAPQTANYGKGAYEETGGMGSTSFDARQ